MGNTNDKPRPDKAKVTSPKLDRLIQFRHIRFRFLTATQTAQSMQVVVGQRLSASTVRRRILLKLTV